MAATKGTAHGSGPGRLGLSMPPPPVSHAEQTHVHGKLGVCPCREGVGETALEMGGMAGGMKETCEK